MNTTHSKVGDLGSKTLKPLPTGVTWKAGVEYEVAWTIQANHGGGCAARPPLPPPRGLALPWPCAIARR